MGGSGVLGHTGRFVYRKNDNYKSLVYKRAFNIVFRFSKNEKINLPHEFIFVFIWYFIGTILLEKSCQKWRVWKNYSGDGCKWGCLEKRGSNLLYTIIFRSLKGGPWSPELLGDLN